MSNVAVNIIVVAMVQLENPKKNIRCFLSEHQMTQDRSRRDGNRPFFREGLSATSQFDELFFFSVDELGTEISGLSRFALQPSDFRPKLPHE